jgi:hypothetical protein
MRTIGRVINMADELLRDVDKSERAAIAQARHDYDALLTENARLRSALELALHLNDNPRRDSEDEYQWKSIMFIIKSALS